MSIDEREKTLTAWGEPVATELPKPRIVRGLRVPVLPSGPLLAQAGGAVALMAGMFLQFGSAVTLIVAGAAGAVLGALREAKRI